MGRLNHHSKERIVKLKEEGYKPSQILRILEGEGVELLCIYIDCAELYGISEQNFNPAGFLSRGTGFPSRGSRPAGRDTGLLTFPWSVLYSSCP
jgi:hypothetical protein